MNKVAELHYHNSSSIALLDFLEAYIREFPEMVIWVPTFICQDFLLLLHQKGYTLRVYNSHNIAAVNLVEDLKKNGKPNDLFLKVCYFGNDMKLSKALKDFIKKKNINIVHDYATSFWTFYERQYALFEGEVFAYTSLSKSTWIATGAISRSNYKIKTTPLMFSVHDTVKSLAKLILSLTPLRYLKTWKKYKNELATYNYQINEHVHFLNLAFVFHLLFYIENKIKLSRLTTKDIERLQSCRIYLAKRNIEFSYEKSINSFICLEMHNLHPKSIEELKVECYRYSLQVFPWPYPLYQNAINLNVKQALFIRPIK